MFGIFIDYPLYQELCQQVHPLFNLLIVTIGLSNFLGLISIVIVS